MAKKPKPDDDDEKPAKLQIDILQMELDRKSPHWLNPMLSSVNDKRRQEIRDKHRARHEAAKKAEQKSKREKAARDRVWRIAKRDAEAKLKRLSKTA